MGLSLGNRKGTENEDGIAKARKFINSLAKHPLYLSPGSVTVLMLMVTVMTVVVMIMIVLTVSAREADTGESIAVDASDLCCQLDVQILVKVCQKFIEPTADRV
ncbi:MAG: hypothetical protein Kow00107_04380 [Planctomycetota bacterium]